MLSDWYLFKVITSVPSKLKFHYVEELLKKSLLIYRFYVETYRFTQLKKIFYSTNLLSNHNLFIEGVYLYKTKIL